MAGGAEKVLAFQFHKGTIRTKHLIILTRLSFYFNSIKVQLEHIKLGANSLQICYFNSIKVQLEHL